MSSFDWNATLTVMRETVPRAQFQNWLDPIEFLRSDEKTICLGVPNRFHEDWVRSHFSTQLKHAIKKQTGSDVQLEFEIILKGENEAAAKSPTPSIDKPTALPPAPPDFREPPPILPMNMGRPALRIVDGNRPEEAPPGEQAPSPTLRPNLPSFPNLFIETSFNSMAVQCGTLFSNGRDWQLNTLVFYGEVGMGKTHLLADIGQKILRAQSHLRVRYTNSESFTNEMVMSYNNNSNRAFKTKYQEETDVLLFDDVQALAGRNKTQEQVLHVFNEITARGGRVAFSSSVPVQRLENFIDGLKSRLLSCVIAEIKTPTFEERVDLLGRVCYQNQMGVEPEVIRALADKGQKDVRELIGTLFRLHTHAKIENRKLDASYLAREGWIREAQRQAVTLEEIVTLVEHNYAISRDELVSKSRKSATAWARQVAMYLGRKFTQLSLEEIGKAFGRDHTTALYAFDKVTEALKEQPTRQYEVEFLVQKLKARGPQSNS